MSFSIRSLLVATTALAVWLTIFVLVPQLAVLIAAVLIVVGLWTARRRMKRRGGRVLLTVVAACWAYFTSFLAAIAIWPRFPPDWIKVMYVASFDWLLESPAKPFMQWYFDVCGGA